MLKPVQMVVGGVKLGIKTCPVHRLKINDKVIYARRQAINNRELIQYVSAGNTEMEISGEVQLWAGQGSMFFLDSIIGMQRNGERLIITLGNGFVFPGEYVVTDVDRDYMDIIDDGGAEIKRWSVSLIQDDY